MRILVAEDEARFAGKYNSTSPVKGFGVDVAYNGSDGYYMGKEYPIDAAIIDIGLLDFRGSSSSSVYASQIIVPILILTAGEPLAGRLKAWAGADDYLVKLPLRRAAKN
jgi:two-component system response regulator PhoP